jgi:predicted amidohydrolase
MRRRSTGGLTVTLVQSCFTDRDYRSLEAFREKVRSLCSRIPSARSPDRLVVFPELTGLWLPLLKGRQPRSLPALVLSLFLGHPLGLLGSLALGRGMAAAFRLDWQAGLHGWIEPFREAARQLAAYVCPGSSVLPPFDWELRRGPHVTGGGVYNTSCLISPRGTILGWTRKVHPPRAERRLGIHPAPLRDLDVYRTDIGRIGILLCLDGFHEAAVQRLDRLGCEIVVQPSANPLPWRKPPRKGMELSQEAQWLGQGLGYLIRGRENIALALNPMSVSSVLGHRDEGRSNLFLNPAKGVETPSQTRLPKGDRSHSGLAAIAASCDREEVLTVELTGLS